MAGTGTAKRKRFCLYLLSAMLLACLASAFSSWQEYRHLSHIPGRVEVFIGIYPNIIRGQNASLLRLSTEIDRHPQADSFAIRRCGTVFAWDGFDWYETIYDRRSHVIEDGNLWAGDTKAWGSVNDAVVKKVVTTSDSFQGFGRSGCKNILP